MEALAPTTRSKLDKVYLQPVGSSGSIHTGRFIVGGGVCFPAIIGAIALASTGKSTVPVKAVEAVAEVLRPAGHLLLCEIFALLVSQEWVFEYAGSRSGWLTKDADALRHLRACQPGDWGRIAHVCQYASMSREPYNRLGSEDGRNAMLLSPIWAFASANGLGRVGKFILERFTLFAAFCAPYLREAIAADDDHIGTIMRWRAWSSTRVINMEWLARILVQPIWKAEHYEAMFADNSAIGLGLRLNLHSLAAGREHLPILEDAAYVIEYDDTVSGDQDAPGTYGSDNPEFCMYRIWIKGAHPGNYEMFRLSAERKLSSLLKRETRVLYVCSSNVSSFIGFATNSLTKKFGTMELTVAQCWVARQLIRIVDLYYRGLTLGKGVLNVDESIGIIEPSAAIMSLMGKNRWIYEMYLYLLYDMSMPELLFNSLASVKGYVTRHHIWRCIQDCAWVCYLDADRMSAALAGVYNMTGQTILSQRCHNLISQLEVSVSTNTLVNVAVDAAESLELFESLILLVPIGAVPRVRNQTDFVAWASNTAPWRTALTFTPTDKLMAFLDRYGYIQTIAQDRISDEMRMFMYGSNRP